MNTILYILALFLIGLAVLCQSMGLTWIDTAIVGFVILLHIPALLPVSAQKKMMGPRFSHITYPETIMPFFILFAWVACGMYSEALWLASLAGLLFSVSIAIQYALVRGVDLIVLGGSFLGAQNPTCRVSPLINIIKKFTFFMRSATSGLSLLVILLFTAQTELQSWWVPLVIVAPCLSTLAIISAGANLKEIANRGATIANKAIAASISRNPPDCVVYYSSPKISDHKSLHRGLLNLKNKGLTTAVISREFHSIEACQSSVATYKWIAPTVDSLDAFAQPNIKAAIYLNDSNKNAHFIRLNNMVHILLLDGDPASLSGKLKSNMAIYDAIIAPDPTTAMQWRKTENHDLSSKIFEIDASAAELMTENKSKPRRPRLSLSLTSDGLENADIRQINTTVSILTQWAVAHKDRHFSVSLDIKNKLEAFEGLYSTLQNSAAETPNVTVLTHATTTIHDSADILIATHSNDLWALAQTKKPILWLGAGAAPEGTVRLGDDLESVTTQIAEALACKTPQNSPNISKQRYITINELICDLHDIKFSRRAAL